MRFARGMLIAGLLLAIAAAPSAARPSSEVGARIINGSDAPAGAWPSIAFLAIENTYACTGSLITPTVILTAGHCVYVDGEPADPATSTARIGVIDRFAPPAVRWQSAVAHPRYDPDALEYDVALVTLSTASAATPMALLAPVQDALVAAGTQVEIAGWGRTSNGSQNIPRFLKQASVPLISDGQCSSVYGLLFSAATMLCAGDLAGGIDTCNGDSGGPLALTVNGVRTLIGDTSWGPNTGCADPTRPGVYGRISAFRPWIATQLSDPRISAVTSAGQTVSIEWTAGDPSAAQVPVGFTVTAGAATTTTGGDARRAEITVDRGGATTVTVSATSGTDAKTASWSGTPTPTRAPAVTARVDGAPRVGSLLTATGTSDDPWGGALTYAWRVDGVLAQEGAQTTYRPTAAQAGRPVTVTVSAANAVGTGSSVVDAGRVEQAPQVKAGPVAVRGSARVGGRLQARPPAVAGYPQPKTTYRWFRNGRLVRSAKTAVYRVRPVDAGVRITGRITWANAAGTVTRALRPVTISR